MTLKTLNRIKALTGSKPTCNSNLCNHDTIAVDDKYVRTNAYARRKDSSNSKYYHFPKCYEGLWR
ncbi:MAG: hypothetical protein E6L03_10530 [Thaumarchaeota archaeon]|nr:MAG: hypothetical protein E6L03_10530 [Nitrososphaerota archaeon]